MGDFLPFRLDKNAKNNKNGNHFLITAYEIIQLSSLAVWFVKFEVSVLVLAQD